MKIIYSQSNLNMRIFLFIHFTYKKGRLIVIFEWPNMIRERVEM